MPIEAPLSKHTRNNFLIGIAVCLGLALWCGYDGYFNQTFQQDHPEWWSINRAAPFFFLPIAVILGAWFHAIRGRKLVAADSELVFSTKKKIPYDAIEKIDKTHFDDKGFFTVTYKTPAGRETNHKLSGYAYDNLRPLLDHLSAKIT